MRKVPLKNYLIITIIMMVSVASVFYLVNWYNTNQNHYKETSIIVDLIKEVKFSEFDDYMTENPDFIIYLGNKMENINVKFEKNLKKFITKKDLQKQFVFMDITEFDNKDSNLVKNHLENIANFKAHNYIIIVDNQKIKNILVVDESIKDSKVVESFLKENEVL